jgi:peroxiredoxin
MSQIHRRVELDRSLQSHAGPGFRLRSQEGHEVSLADHRSQANLVLLFANGLEEPTLRAALRAFATRRAKYEAENATVLAIVHASATEMAPWAQRLDGRPPQLLADPDGSTHRHYAELLPEQPGPGEAIVVVLDRFGAPHIAFLSSEPADPALHERLLSWLKGIELECPECGVSEWL